MRFFDCTIAGVEDCWIAARFWTLEAGIKIFVWTSECHARVDTHVVVNQDDPSEVPDTASDLIIRKKFSFRLWVAPEKGCNELAVGFLWNICEDEIHVQGKTEVSIVDIKFLFGQVPETGKVILLKLSAKRGTTDLPDCRKGISEVTEMCGELLSIK